MRPLADSPALSNFANDDSSLVADLPWSTEIRAGQHAGAVPLIEQHLEENPDSAAGKLWWVRCQAALKQLPITALTAPLEALYPRLETADRQLQLLACSTLLQLADLLRARSQPRVAVSTLGHGIHFAELSQLEPSLQKALLAHAIEAVETELEEAPLRKESKEYLTGLQRQLEELRAAHEKIRVEAPAVKPSTRETPKGNQRLSSKAILEAAKEEAHVSANHARAGWDAETTAQENSQANRRNALVVLSAAAAVAFAAVYLLFPDRFAADESAAINLVVPEPAAPVSPGVPNPGSPTEGADAPVQLASASLPESGGPDLTAIDSRIEQLGVGERLPAQKDQTAEKPDQPAIAPSEVDLAATDPKNAPRLRGPRPAGRDELVSLSGLPPASNEIAVNNVPQMDPGRFATTRVEEIGTSPRKAAVPAESPESTQPPPRSEPAAQQGRQEEIALDGSPLRGYEVQNFDPPLVYHTVTSTNVLARPSFLAPSLARLESNTPIHVTRRMGLWLQLRSTEGRVGYIYAQDASQKR